MHMVNSPDMRAKTGAQPLSCGSSVIFSDNQMLPAIAPVTKKQSYFRNSMDKKAEERHCLERQDHPVIVNFSDD